MANDKDRLVALATQLLDEGPKQTHPTTRRVRAIYNGQTLFDTNNALFVWETHLYYPFYFIPSTDFRFKDASKVHQVIERSKGKAVLLELNIQGKKPSSFAIHFENPSGSLDGLVRIDFKSMDAWFEEDTRILIHPKDPFKRIDVLPSSRHVKVSLHGIELASATFGQHLYETGLKTRYYLPPTAVNQAILRHSETRTSCPYKGEASYYDVVLTFHGEEKVYKDLVWYYSAPLVECAAIQNFLCFYNEKVDLQVEGIPQQQ